ncbi:MAG: hypothetical protein KAU20_07380, partial [Nanoarchaeota archaeon]|nr:hypothetical protein [Nanoarchaeota archaeon]
VTYEAGDVDTLHRLIQIGCTAAGDYGMNEAIKEIMPKKKKKSSEEEDPPPQEEETVVVEEEDPPPKPPKW